MVKSGVERRGVRDYDNMWDGTIDSNMWTVGGSATGSGSYAQTESKGGIQLTCTAFGGSGSYSASSNVRCLLDLKTVYKVQFFVMLTSHYYYSGGNTATSDSILQLTDNGSNNVTIASVSTASHTTTTARTSGIGMLLTLTYDGTNITVDYHSSQTGDGTFTLHSNGGTTNVSTWANVYIKLTANANDNNFTSSHNGASIMLMEIVQKAMGSLGTA